MHKRTGVVYQLPVTCRNAGRQCVSVAATAAVVSLCCCVAVLPCVCLAAGDARGQKMSSKFPETLHGKAWNF